MKSFFNIHMMKRFHFLIWGLAVACFLAGCDRFKKEEPVNRADFRPVKINDQYRLELPKHMKEGKTLNESASLQFQNIFKEMYVIVIDEEKQGFIDAFADLGEYDSTKSPVENYRAIQLQKLSEAINITTQTTPVAKKINLLDAEQVQIDGSVAGVSSEISYFLTFIEGDSHLYMIMAWTMRDRRDRYSKTFDYIADSFKELPL